MRNQKFLLFVVSVIMVFVVSAHADGLILRDVHGHMEHMDHFHAMKACPAGTHLPTAREIAEDSHAYGAKGILEVGQVILAKIPDYYELVSVINPNGKKDEFYFSNEGYKHNNDLGSGWFWSSSIDSSNHEEAYTINGVYDYFAPVNRYYPYTSVGDHYNSVRCIYNH